jgi:hypothetical protein
LAVKDLRLKLLEHHTDWKIPERRVKKFLKRHLNKHGDPSGADDDATVLSVTSKSPGTRLRNIFKVKRDSTNAIISNNPPESAPKAPLLEDDEESPETEEPAKQDEAKVEEGEFEPAPVEQSRSLEQAYSDDNDGLKKNDCHCGEACAIM